MKRRLTKLVVFLLLGAIVNVAVAWGLTWKLDVYQESVLWHSVNVSGVVGESPNHEWNVTRYNCTGVTRVFSSYFSPASDAGYDDDPGDLLPSWNQDFFSGVGREDLTNLVRMQDGRGLPMLSLWGQAAADEKVSSLPDCELEYAILTNPNDPLTGSYGNLRALSILMQIQFLPLHPIWPGFAINTIFYAVILWMLTLGPFTARRMIRRRRGQCIKCSYNLRGHSGGGREVCPECGATTH